MRLAENLCYGLARQRVLKRQPGASGQNPASFDTAAYQGWRKDELEGQFRKYFSFDSIRGKDVVDFGCGGGELSFLMAENGARSVTGIEADSKQYGTAVRQLEQMRLPVQPKLQLAKDLDRIDLPDACCDVILCFDVLEHILEYRKIIPEWRRILRAGGRILIWWVPFYHPYGHHVESLVPIPWAHVLFSDQTIIRTCARIYDMKEFAPRIWDLEPNGQKKPNKWRAMRELPTLNRLTIRGFEALCREVGLAVERAEYHPINPVRKLLGGLATAPVLREFLSQCAIYELRRA